MRLCKLLLTVKVLLFLMRDFLSRPRITDLLIEFKGRFLSGYAGKSSLEFFVENKSGKTILLVVLR